MPRDKVTRISMSLPPVLLQKFEDSRRSMGYSDRSKGMQAALRNFAGEHEWLDKEETDGAGAILLVYDHEVRKLQEDLTDVQHSFKDIISSSLHIHLDDRNCLEVIAVRGQNRIVRSMAKQLAHRRGVKQVKIAMVGST